MAGQPTYQQCTYKWTERIVETCPPPRQYGPEKQAEIIKQIIKMLFDLDIIEILQVSGASYTWFLNLHLLVNGD